MFKVNGNAAQYEIRNEKIIYGKEEFIRNNTMRDLNILGMNKINVKNLNKF